MGDEFLKRERYKANEMYICLLMLEIWKRRIRKDTHELR